VLQGFQESVLDIHFHVFLGRFRFRRFFLIQTLGLISLKVNFDRVHPVNAFLVPRCLLLEEWPQLLSKSLILLPILNEISLHELLIKDEYWEVQLALFVLSDALVVDLRQVNHLFAEFDLFTPDVAIHAEFIVIFALVDQLDLLELRLLKLKL